jgi:hypothetical protein
MHDPSSESLASSMVNIIGEQLLKQVFYFLEIFNKTLNFGRIISSLLEMFLVAGFYLY